MKQKRIARKETRSLVSGGERIAKRLARAGVASRREAEGMIAAGRVTVNGRRLSSPAFNVRESDRIEVDGVPIPAVERTRLFLFHKPQGVVTTTRDPEGRKTVFELLPEGMPRVMTIGRLDINTEGLLLLTNDGGLARVLELPSTGWLRRYRVRVHGKVDPKALEGLKEGMAVGGVYYGAVEATLDRQQGSNAWLTIGLREGKNREVRNILTALGLEVTRLIRVSYGPFQLGTLPRGAVQEVRGRTLREQLGPRLIEEADANFDAPVMRPFPNVPVRGGDVAGRGQAEAKEKDARPRRGNRIGGKAQIERKPRREDRREDALGRLQTRPGHGLKAGENTRKRDPLPRSRAANFWRPKSAKPIAVGKAGREGVANGEEPSGGAEKARHPTRRRTSSREPGRKPGRR